MTNRFISEDPLGFGSGDSNLYAHVGNSPSDRIDPSGFDCVYSQSTGAMYHVTTTGPGSITVLLTTGYSGGTKAMDGPGIVRMLNTLPTWAPFHMEPTPSVVLVPRPRSIARIAPRCKSKSIRRSTSLLAGSRGSTSTSRALYENVRGTSPQTTRATPYSAPTLVTTD